MKRQNLKHILLTVFGLFLLFQFASAQIPDDIIFSLKTGNAEKLANHFNQNIELVVLDNENVYSKAHAQQVISDFFKNNPPKEFSIIHQGGKADSKYAIGTLKTSTESFRVYFLLKLRNNVNYIHQLRITKQND